MHLILIFEGCFGNTISSVSVPDFWLSGRLMIMNDLSRIWQACPGHDWKENMCERRKSLTFQPWYLVTYYIDWLRVFFSSHESKKKNPLYKKKIVEKEKYADLKQISSFFWGGCNTEHPSIFYRVTRKGEREKVERKSYFRKQNTN